MDESFNEHEIYLKDLIMYKIRMRSEPREFSCVQTQCKDLKVYGYKISQNQMNINHQDLGDQKNKKDVPIEFHPLFDEYLRDSSFKIEKKKEIFNKTILMMTCEKGDSSEEIELSADYNLFCVNDNISPFINKTYKKYYEIMGDDNKINENLNADIDQLNDMEQYFSSHRLYYFVTEKKYLQKSYQNMEGDHVEYQVKLDNLGYDIAIVTSSDLKFKKNLHRLHNHNILSDYSVMKTIETRMDTIIYRSFKDILRLCCSPSKEEEDDDVDIQEYTSFSKLILSQKKDTSFFQMNNDKEDSNSQEVLQKINEHEEEEKEDYVKSNFFSNNNIDVSSSIRDEKNSQISLEEVKSIVYKNACLEGIFPFNIYLNTEREKSLFSKFLNLASKLLQNKSYKLNYHLSMQVGNVLYSFNNSGLFQTYQMQEKERYSSRFNEFTKVRVFDFFVLDDQIDRISNYIYERLSTFNYQIQFYLASSDELNLIIHTRVTELQQQIESLNFINLAPNELLRNSSELEQQKEFKQQEEQFQLVHQIKEDTLEVLNRMLKEKVNRIVYSTFTSYLDLIEQSTDNLIDVSQDPPKFESSNLSYYLNILGQFTLFYDHEKPHLFKIFLKLILTNKQVPQYFPSSSYYPEIFEVSLYLPFYYLLNHSLLQSVRQPRGKGEDYKILLRQLSFIFLSHYFSEFKKFYSWPLIVTETELTKYKLLDNNCQTPGILFSYQIKEIFKENIEPLFITDQERFQVYFKNKYNSMNQNVILKYDFLVPTSTSSILKGKTFNNQQKDKLIITDQKNSSLKMNEQNSNVKTRSNLTNNSSQKQKHFDNFSGIRTSSLRTFRTESKTPIERANFIENNSYKEYYYARLIKSFMHFGSKTNQILNKSLFPLTLKVPMPYHQFFGEPLGKSFMNEIIYGDDLILQVYKVIVNGFEKAEDKTQLSQIRAVTEKILGNDFLQKSNQFSSILQQSYKHTYHYYSSFKRRQTKKQIAKLSIIKERDERYSLAKLQNNTLPSNHSSDDQNSIPQNQVIDQKSSDESFNTKEINLQQSPHLQSSSPNSPEPRKSNQRNNSKFPSSKRPKANPLSLDFLSTLLSIYDSLYFMRNKYYSSKGKETASGPISSNQYYNIEKNAQKSNIKRSRSTSKKSLIKPLISKSELKFNHSQGIDISKLSKRNQNENNEEGNKNNSTNNNNNSLHDKTKEEIMQQDFSRSSSFCEGEQKHHYSNYKYGILDYEKKKYFNSKVRHELKDNLKELSFYYYNSIRMKQSTFTQKNKLSYIGFILIKDPSTKYPLPS